ncbi:MAG: MFS transporter [Parachlamydiaceae bacterium]|nr:MFS transporter [Parachlamydiaceae bacterium]
MKILYLLNRLLSSPLEVIYVFLIFIITKDLGATPLQLSILACSKPAVSLVSAFANGFIFGKPKSIKPFLLLCNLIGLLPCLFFPYVENTWFFIASYACFMTTLRASYPAWIEVLKCKLEIKELSKTVATGSSINYSILILFPLVFTYFLDQDPSIWKNLFVCMAILQFLFFLILLVVPLKFNLQDKQEISGIVSTNVIKEGWLILRTNSSFVKYQILFFLGGAGVVIVQPILPIYFNEALHLSYSQLALAFSFCRGISFVCSTPFWLAYTQKVSLYSLNALVNVFSSLFIMFILMAGLGIEWLLIGYVMYGAMQAGCELSWNLSGPLFSKNKESTPYSCLNLFFVSFRGMIFPFLGQLIYSWSNAFVLFSLAGGLCLLSVLYALSLNQEYNLEEKTCG